MALIICAECGKQMSDKASACPHCGAPYSPAPVEIKCEECGSVLPVGADACPNCGCPVNIEQQMSAQPFPAAQTAQPIFAAQAVQPIFAPPPAVSAPTYGEEQFENVIIKGKKSPVGRIVCTVIACVLWLAAAVAIGLVIYDYNFAETVGGFYYGNPPIYYSSLAGGKYTEQYRLVIGWAGAAAAVVIGAVVFIAGLGKRIKVTNARVVIKRPFKPTPRLTWDRIETAAKETGTSFVIKSGEKKYHVRNLKNQEEVLGVISDMLSRKSSGTLKMPAVYGVKSAFGRFLRKKTAVIAASAAVVVVIAAAVLTPVIMKLSARQVTDVAYEWRVKSLYLGNLIQGPKVNEITITGCYSGGWLNGKPYGTGTFLSDSGSFFPFNKGYTYTGTWKNGEPCKGVVVWTSADGERSWEIFDGGFNHSKPHGQCKITDQKNYSNVFEGELKYGAILNGTWTNANGEVIATYKNGKQVD